MQRSMRRRKSIIPELPEEVIHEEILIRLPIKSVVRFKSVSKSWLSLFRNPKFVENHLSYGTAHDPNYYDRLIADRRYGRMFILSREEACLFSYCHYNMIGSAHGIVCLRHDSKLFLWNPAIHQIKEFTLPPTCFDSEPHNIGFGFDPVSNDYKVVVCYLSRYASVYSSGSNSWTNLLVSSYMFPNHGTDKFVIPTTMVKDCPYWSCCTYSPDNQFIISLALVKFDATSNEFKSLTEFYFDASDKRGRGFEFVNMKDHPTLMTYKKIVPGYSSNNMIIVYSLDEEEGCGVWRMMYSVRPITPPLDYGGSHCLSPIQGFKYGGETVMYGYDFYCYDPKTDAMKRLPGTPLSSVLRCFIYTPSLVFLQGMKSVRSKSQTRTRCRYFRNSGRSIKI